MVKAINTKKLRICRVCCLERAKITVGLPTITYRSCLACPNRKSDVFSVDGFMSIFQKFYVKRDNKFKSICTVYFSCFKCAYAIIFS